MKINCNSMLCCVLLIQIIDDDIVIPKATMISTPDTKHEVKITFMLHGFERQATGIKS